MTHPLTVKFPFSLLPEAYVTLPLNTDVSSSYDNNVALTHHNNDFSSHDDHVSSSHENNLTVHMCPSVQLCVRTLPLLTPQLCTVGWFAKTQQPEKNPNTKNHWNFKNTKTSRGTLFDQKYQDQTLWELAAVMRHGNRQNHIHHDY